MQNDRRLQPYPRLGLTAADDGAAKLPHVRVSLHYSDISDGDAFAINGQDAPSKKKLSDRAGDAKPVVCVSDQESMGG